MELFNAGWDGTQGILKAGYGSGEEDGDRKMVKIRVRDHGVRIMLPKRLCLTINGDTSEL